jgi:hypothetical protein
MNHTYSWYNLDAKTNGGLIGTERPADSICNGMDRSKCNTQNYVTEVNKEGLCGKTDWRLPSLEELRSLNQTGRFDPAIDANYFPNTAPDQYWSSSTFARDSAKAWISNLYEGSTYKEPKSTTIRVRLVRSAS